MYQTELQRWPEWMDIRTFADYSGFSYRTLESWKRLGHLPPHTEFTARHHRWTRSDIDAWKEVRRRELLDDYVSLRHRIGVEDAWAVMLARLEEARGRTQAVVAQEVAR